MMLIGYRMLFGEMCTLLNIRVDPDVDYVEDDFARETLIANILRTVKGADLSIMVLSNDVYYLGLTLETCQRELPSVMSTRNMAEQIARCSVQFQRELKKVGLFKYLEGKVTRVSEPTVIQCDKVYPITA